MKYLLIFLFFISNNLFASSCCGGGGSSSLIITADNRAEMSLGYSYRKDLGQTNSEGYSNLNNNNTKDQTKRLTLQGQYQFKDYWQVGAKLGMAEKNFAKSGQSEVNRGLSEIDLQITHEYLPEYIYNAYKPRAFVYVKSSIPFSKSLYDSNSKINSDVYGSGLYSFGFGHLLFKRWDEITLKLGLEWNHLFGKNFAQFKLHDYEKWMIPFGVSHSFNDTDLSLSLTSTFNYQSGKRQTGTINSLSSSERFWDLSTSLTYSHTRYELWSLSYSDSTLIGESINSPLYRSVGLNYSYVFEI